jgi:hypothetical protein|tara:strand:- start:35 stop:175 length:141 start_codon:yes stop_codon:yes gene_type:complete
VIVQNSDFSRAVKTSSIFARDGSGILRIQIVNDEEGENFPYPLEQK